MEMLDALVDHFSGSPVKFEACAAELVRMALSSVTSIDLTRPTRDGGRDAIGSFEIGVGASSILVDFSIEAKCYASTNSVGVREMSRLISRLRHRQFGVMVTTSWIHSQAYREVKEDGLPIILMCGADIVRTLQSNGMGTVEELRAWLDANFQGRD